MANLRNSVQLIGNLGKDPEVKTFDSGKKMASVTLATNESYINQKGERVTDTQWHNLVIWGNLVDVAVNFLKKGTEVVVQGKLVYRSYETSGGEKRYITEINVQDLLLVGNKSVAE